ncbi:MAG: S-adenosylmethionine synthetase N-terminal domain-containing protein, partial [bacterium]
MTTRRLFTSESVSEGHPDKVADGIADCVLDAHIAKDKHARVACELLVTTGLVVIAGEITSKAVVDHAAIARDKIRRIGYDDPAMGFSHDTCAVLVTLDKQSPDISQGVTAGEGMFKEQGAGDQGMMFGYACDETKELMPMPIMFAHRLSMALAVARRNGKLPFLRPDGKSQVSVVYEDGKPAWVDTIVVSCQHKP